MALGCSHAAEYLDQVLSDAVRQEIAPHAFLDLLLETELSGREARRVKTSLRLSNLPTGQTWRTSTSPTGHLPLRPRSAHTELISLERCDKVPPAIVRSFGRIRSRARREHSPGTCRRLLLSFRDSSRYKVLASHTAASADRFARPPWAHIAAEGTPLPGQSSSTPGNEFPAKPSISASHPKIALRSPKARIFRGALGSVGIHRELMTAAAR